MQFTYFVYYPGGNMTALVEGAFHADLKKKINRHLLSLEPDIEQVGFVTKKHGGIFLDMAGGEFCGNATRSALFHYLKEGDDSAVIVSGAPFPLRGGIAGMDVWAQMPVITGHAKHSVFPLDVDHILVKMHGISHLLVYRNNIFKEYLSRGNDGQEALKKYALHICSLYNVYDPSAYGVMFIEETDAGFSLYPVVCVPAINTLFFESACGSGSTALGLYEAFLSGTSKSTVVFQPSGSQVAVTVTIDENGFQYASIKGNVSHCYSAHTSIDLS